jgi:serine/threonine protein kinase
VAVKVLVMPERSQAYLRFRQEIEKLQLVGNHPSIVRCHAHGCAVFKNREYPWYAMEFAAGGDLAGQIAEFGSQPVLPWHAPDRNREIIRIFRDLAAAVAYLHDKGIVHRDLKPSNVLLLEDGTVKLSDFGLVKGDLSITTTGALLGTQRYMAPEQSRGLPVDKSTDVYALGVILAELATGQRPEPDSGVDQGTTLRRSAGVQQLPNPLKAWLKRCTDVSPTKRPTDAGSALQEFEGMLASL